MKEINKLFGDNFIEKFHEKAHLSNEIIKSESIQYYSVGTNNYFPLQSEESFIKVDWIPKVLKKEEFNHLKKGIIQRMRAMNFFMADVYKNNEQNIVPQELIETSKFYNKDNIELNFNFNVLSHMYGIDIVQDNNNEYIVLEDNLGMPGGIGYAQKIREVAHSIFVEFSDIEKRDIEDYSKTIANSLESLSLNKQDPLIVYLQRGPGASGSYEYQQLIKNTNIVMADPEDIELINNTLYLRTANNDFKKIDVVYLRLFNKRFKTLHKKLKVAINNGLTCVTFLGNMLANDKAIFEYIPSLIKYYLDEEPLLKQPKTFWLPENKELVHLKSKIIKKRWGAGGKEVYIIDELNKKELLDLKQSIKKNPEEYIIQDLVHIKKDIYYNLEAKLFQEGYSDLRLYSVMDSNYECRVMSGGISRVSFKDSMKVNVGLGGAMKDIWIMTN